jgi:hypothetical protein
MISSTWARVARAARKEKAGEVKANQERKAKSKSVKFNLGVSILSRHTIDLFAF